MNKLDVLPNKQGFTGPTFSLTNRLKRLVWQSVWMILGRWTPPQAHRWRIFILRIFGANVSWKAFVYSDVKIWAPWNLTIDDYGTLGRGVICYNIAFITIGIRSVISQGVHLCTGTHDYQDPMFPLTAKPINIGTRVWICADAFIGPGVTVADGVVLAAASVAYRNLDAWTVYGGNPARFLRSRPVITD